MEKNELKKILYREKPIANLDFIRKGKVYIHVWLTTYI
jgi:hypothetical protein